MRCFKEFIKCLPHLMKTDLDVEVEIAGEDKICYGGYQPGKNDTWGEWAKRYLADANNRVRFLGRLSYTSYKNGSKKVGATFIYPSICLQLEPA